MSGIKTRRLSLRVDCHPADCVGEYVPFYFCPRSIMLFVIHRANHPDLSYRGGQGPIVHLEADLHDVIAWAKTARQRWAFSLSNAGAVYAQFRARVAELDQINWEAVAATDFRPAEIKEGKQAEFLVHGSLPWTLVSRIGVWSAAVQGSGRGGHCCRCAPATGSHSTRLVLLSRNAIMTEITDRRHPLGRRGSAGEHGQLRGHQRTRHRTAVPQRIPGELQGVRGGLQARRGSAGPHVRVRNRATDEPALHHQLPDQAPLAREEPAWKTSNLASLRSCARCVNEISVPSPCHHSGCGLGGLQWSKVRPRIEAAFAEVPDVHLIIFAPAPRADAGEVTRSTDVPRMTPGRAALVGLMYRYLTGLLDPFISLLEVHKLMYFMQEAGEPLRLRYAKAPYGPYAENLRHVLSKIEGHLVTGYADGRDDPEKQIELVPGAVEDATTFLAEHVETHERFDRVAELVQGFETPFGLELLSTVHWVATKEGALTAPDALERTYAWNERKRRFSPRQIHIAWDVLRDKGWLPSGVGASHR